MTDLATAVSSIPEGYLSDVTALVNLIRADEDTTEDVLRLVAAAEAVAAEQRTVVTTITVDLGSTDAREALACQQLVDLAVDVAQVVVTATLQGRDPVLTPGEVADLLADHRADLILLDAGLGSFHAVLALVTRNPDQALAVVGLAGTVMLAVAAIPAGPLVVVGTVAAGIPAIGVFIRRRRRGRLHPASIPPVSAPGTITVEAQTSFRYVLVCAAGTSPEQIARFREHLHVDVARLEIDPRSVHASRPTEASPVHLRFDGARLFGEPEYAVVEACARAAELEWGWFARPGEEGPGQSGPDRRKWLP